MPSAFSNGSKTRFLDLESARRALAEIARRAQEREPRISRVILFGSYARGDATPRSDADLFVVLESSPHPRRIDRLEDLYRVFYPSPVPLDIVPWTAEEVRRGRSSGDPFIARVMQEGIEL